MNDNHVSQVSVDRVIKSQAYVLFYSQIPDPATLLQPMNSSSSSNAAPTTTTTALANITTTTTTKTTSSMTTIASTAGSTTTTSLEQVTKIVTENQTKPGIKETVGVNGSNDNTTVSSSSPTKVRFAADTESEMILSEEENSLGEDRKGSSVLDSMFDENDEFGDVSILYCHGPHR
jgi:hypothetical protein